MCTKQAAQKTLLAIKDKKPLEKKLPPLPEPAQSTVYQVRIKGHLDAQWTDWFEDLTITLEENGDTLLTGPVIDQAALYGLLKKIRDLGIPLISVNRVETNDTHPNRLRKEKK
jgi:hypothetical protein